MLGIRANISGLGYPDELYVLTYRYYAGAFALTTSIGPGHWPSSNQLAAVLPSTKHSDELNFDFENVSGDIVLLVVVKTKIRNFEKKILRHGRLIIFVFKTLNSIIVATLYIVVVRHARAI